MVGAVVVRVEADLVMLDDDVFDLRHFAERHDPVVIGTVPPELMFDCSNYAIRILDMPVKVPKELPLLPKYALRFSPFVDQVVRHLLTQHRWGWYDRRYLYLTVDQGLVKKGSAQRALGCHVDGLQGARVQPKVPTDLSYTVSDTLPTVFYKQTWELYPKFDLAYDNLFTFFEGHYDPRAEWRPAPYEIVESTAYTVHRADVAPHDLVRTFLRLTASVREFDRLGNSINPLLGPLWKYESRDTPATLR